MVLSSYVRAFPLIGLLLIGLALPGQADVTMGANARDVAMGGAGLASGDAQGAANNPALLAESDTMFGILWPSVDVGTSGLAGWSDALSLISKAKIDTAEAFDLMQEFGSSQTALDVTANAGVALPRADLVGSVAVHTEITPNDEFAGWVDSGMTGDIPEDARADVYAGGLANLPSLGFGFYLPQPKSIPGTTALGFRVKWTQAYYSHYVYDDADPEGRLADEMGTKESLKTSSPSADMGMMFTPKGNNNVRLALVVNNLIEPKAITFATPSERFGSKKQLAPRTLSLGTAWVDEDITLAADLVDLTSNSEGRQLRLGVEWRSPTGIALRGGYNTKNGLTAGIGFGSLGLAYSADTPVMLSSSVSF